MPPSVTEPESSSTSQILRSSSSRFPNLRGVRWRTNLGILPSFPSSSMDELRRVTADSRRRYANLRRCLLVSPHFPKAGDRSPDLVMDNPLSQNPDSMWSRFFRNAELERTVNQDLSRLYPEHESYFQTPTCQAILRRILLLWCLRHPEYGYKQGMHELLAPFLYVLHIDVQCLAQVRKLHEDHFSDKFDSLPFPNVDDYGSQKVETKVAGLEELDPETNDIVLLNDAYGAEGELGVISSERFIEHDAYCMFDALMNGSQGVVAMANYYSPSPALGSITGLPPVIEASSALYHLLSKVDSSLHSHLVELGVEPQYFALRWLRVLFGREFSLEDLLIIWDEIFASSNGFSISFGENNRLINFTVLTSPRGAFIVGMVVSMILHLRPVLLATENATSCLQRLLNFPENINVEKLIEKAKSLQALAMDPSITSASPTVWFFEKSKPSYVRDHSMLSVKSLPDTYWEEKWRSLHNAEGVKKGSESDPLTSRVKVLLSRAESVPSPMRFLSDRKDSQSLAQWRLLEDLSQEIDFKTDSPFSVETDTRKDSVEDPNNESCIDEELRFNRNTASEESSSIFSAATSPLSSVASNISSMDDNDDEAHSHVVNAKECQVSETKASNTDEVEKRGPGSKEQQRKTLLNKFQWFWKFSRNGEVATEGGSNSEGQRPDKVGNTLRSFAQSILENIQVIESVFQQESLENLSNNPLGGKGQVMAAAALKELRKISNILSEL